MAQIVINEISQNYSYNIGTNAYATIAMPITASWGPAFQGPETLGKTDFNEVLETVQFTRFPATQDGLEAFVSTYRGPASNYRLAKDFSYQLAMTLMTVGYDVLVCRVSPGTNASTTFNIGGSDEPTRKIGGVNFTVKAKYPGSFGNKLRVTLQKVPNYPYWNLITYVYDENAGIQTAVENLTFVFDLMTTEETQSDTIPHIDELESNFLTFAVDGQVDDSTSFEPESHLLTGGSDKKADEEVSAMIDDAKVQATERYTAAGQTDSIYLTAFDTLKSNIGEDVAKASTIRYMEWVYTAAYHVYDLLKDKLSYNPNRVISPGWDDQNVTAIDDQEVQRLLTLSPLHIKLMDTAYASRCATAYIDIPRCLPRTGVYDSSTSSPGYAQMLARYSTENLWAVSVQDDINVPLYPTHSALFAPWGQYTYIGTSKMNTASPSFLALMIERAMIKNQSIQYEWALPTNRRQTLNIGKMDYTVPKKYLDEWQTLEGVGVNVITDIPDMGVSLWGNSTLYEVPPAVYQALANLSTRKLVNAVEDLAYRCGISITFQYNNEQAYNAFYAGMTPLLDTMKNVGAIEDYYVRMSTDINGLDRINYNAVIGKIYLVINGVINDIFIDLIALPPGTDLDQYRQ